MVGGRCPICQEYFVAVADISATPCGHTFHAHCLLGWIQRSPTCPSCRKPAPENRIIMQLFFDRGEDSIVDSPSAGPSVGNLRNKVSDLEIELAERKKEVEQLEGQLSREKTSFATQTRELTRERKKTQNLESALTALRKELAGKERLESENGELRRKMERMERRMGTYRVYDSLIKGSSEQLAGVLRASPDADLQSCLNAFKERYDQISEEKAALSEKLRKVEAEREKYKRLASGLREEVKIHSRKPGPSGDGEADYDSPFNPQLRSFINRSDVRTPLLAPQPQRESVSAAATSTPFMPRVTSLAERKEKKADKGAAAPPPRPTRAAAAVAAANIANTVKPRPWRKRGAKPPPTDPIVDLCDADSPNVRLPGKGNPKRGGMGGGAKRTGAGLLAPTDGLGGRDPLAAIVGPGSRGAGGRNPALSKGVKRKAVGKARTAWGESSVSSSGSSSASSKPSAWALAPPLERFVVREPKAKKASRPPPSPSPSPSTSPATSNALRHREGGEAGQDDDSVILLDS